jgi:hypothetical protein
VAVDLRDGFLDRADERTIDGFSLAAVLNRDDGSPPRGERLVHLLLETFSTRCLANFAASPPIAAPTMPPAMLVSTRTPQPGDLSESSR